jgi:hypothetical protein
MKKIMLLLAAVCLLTAGVAVAQVEDTVIYQRTTILDIDEPMQVPGELVRPSSSYLPVKKGADFDLLIPVRDNFLPEMMKTVSGL